MKLTSPLLTLLALMTLVGCKADDKGDDTTSTTDDTTSTTDDTVSSTDDTASSTDEPSTLDLAVEAIGGAEALTSLERLRVEASGNRRIDYEGLEPSELVDAVTYTSTYSYDLSADALRLDMTRTPLFEAFQAFPAEEYSVVLNGDVGGLTAQAGFYPAGAMPSLHVGALSQQQRLFHPHIPLRTALADPYAVTDGGQEDYDGRLHHILTITDADAELRMFVDAETGLISKLETTENNPLLRDVPVEVRYADWQSYGSLSFPGTVEVYAVGGLVHSEVRSGVELEPADMAADAFVLPVEAGTPEVDEYAYTFGQQNHQVMEAFWHIYFGYDLGEAAAVSELADGVVLLGGSANSVGVVVDDEIVVLEGPNSPAHGTHLIEMLDAEFPGVPVSHLIQSHHHQDHSSGVRSFAAVGATVVVGPGVGSFFEEVLAAPSTLRPDALSQLDITPTVQEVDEDDTFVITGSDVTITAYHVSENPHAEDMLITVVDTEGARFVYEADLYNAGFGFTAVLEGPESFIAALKHLGIIDATCASDVPLSVIPAHGLVQSIEDSVAELNSLGIDIGCS